MMHRIRRISGRSTGCGSIYTTGVPWFLSMLRYAMVYAALHPESLRRFDSRICLQPCDVFTGLGLLLAWLLSVRGKLDR